MTVQGLNHEALGEVDVDGTTLLVYGAVPGDRVTVAVEAMSRQKPIAWGRVKDVMERGSGFVTPPCGRAAPVAGRCGGCPTMHMTSALQDRLKHNRVAEALEEVGIRAPVGWHGAEAKFAYRNRGNFVPARTKKDAIVLGSYAPRSHNVVWMKGCKTVRPCIAAVTRRLEIVFSKKEIPIHPEPGALRYVTLRGSAEGEVLVEFIVNAWPVPWLDAVSAEVGAWDPVVGVSASVNESSGNAIRVAPSLRLLGRETLEEPVGALVFDMAASSFSQLNSETTAKMYQAAAESISKATVVWDLYCGFGGLGLTVANRDTSTGLYGADVAEESIDLARNAARRHGITAHFETVDLSERFTLHWPDPGVIIVNPPRRGLDETVLGLLKQSPATQIVYMSCNPKSFARDARVLADAHFNLVKVDGYDMLPQTTHVELLGVFEKREIGN